MMADNRPGVQTRIGYVYQVFFGSCLSYFCGICCDHIFSSSAETALDLSFYDPDLGFSEISRFSEEFTKDKGGFFYYRRIFDFPKHSNWCIYLY